jgi:predicted nucleic acid-binding protein
MKTNCFIFAFIVSTCLCFSMAFAFYSHGPVAGEVDYDDMEIYPPKIECDEPVVKGDLNETECMAKVTASLTYAFTEDQEFKATLLFYNIFNEIMGEAEIKETLRWEEDHVDFVDFIYIYPEYDFHAVKNSHHIEWKIHKQNKDESMGKKQ